jgi:hypothetical protein
MVTNDPLTALIVDEADVAREDLASALGPLLRLTAKGSVVLEEGFDRLKAEQKVCAVLLGVRAAHLLELRAASDASPKEIAELSGMAGGTVRPKLMELVRRRVVRASKGRYEVPIPRLRAAVAFIKEGS